MPWTNNWRIVSGSDSGDLSDSGHVITGITGKKLSLKYVVIGASVAGSFTITDTDGTALVTAPPVIYLGNSQSIVLNFEPGQITTLSGKGFEVDCSVADNASIYMEAGFLG